MREPEFIQALATSKWSAHAVHPFTDEQSAPDSLTGQPVQEPDHVSEEENTAVNIVSVTLEDGELYYWGMTKSGYPTRLYRNKGMAMTEMYWMDAAFDTIAWCFSQNRVFTEFGDLLQDKGRGLIPLRAPHPLRKGVRLYLGSGVSPFVVAAIGKTAVKLFPGSSYEDIETELDAFLGTCDANGRSIPKS